MSWFTLQRDDISLRGWDGGEGLPVIFQHGLGGDEAQVAEVFPDSQGIRRLTLECRGQGKSSLGNASEISIANFANDIVAFTDFRGADRFVIGGISMGAAIALRIAIRHPGRVKALILARPAWLWGAAPENMKPFSEVASYLRKRTVDDFEASTTAQKLAREAPDNLLSLKKFFSVKDRSATAALLETIAADGPGVSEVEVRAIAVPTLVIGHKIDAVHPLEFAQTLASRIVGSQLVEITPKATDKPKHVAEFRKHVAQFLSSNSKGNIQ
ncbi:MAG TPA: alpha/beta hydrolase [Aestuariivirga sp.]